jgi:lysozyme
LNRDRILLSIAVAAFAIAGTVIAKWEGVRYKAYLDTGGIATICFGHTKGVKLGDVATEAQCREYLAYDMAEAEAIVNKYVKVPLGKYHRAVTISLVFNIGETQFARSTYLRKLNQGDYAGACLELKRWVYDNGVYIRGLAHRREDEFRLCTKIDFSLVYSGVTFTQH